MSLIGDLLRWVLGRPPKSTQESMDKALIIATNLRRWLRSPTVSIITAIIPGEWDNELRYQVLKLLDKIIPTLYIGSECGNDLKCWAEKLVNLPKHTQDMNTVKLAQVLTAYLDGNKARQSVYDGMVQLKVTKQILSV